MLRGRPRMMTRDLFAVANLLVSSVRELSKLSLSCVRLNRPTARWCHIVDMILCSCTEDASDDVQRSQRHHGRVQLPGGQTSSTLFRQEVRLNYFVVSLSQAQCMNWIDGSAGGSLCVLPPSECLPQ